MTGPNHSDLQRDFGRMEGKQDAMGARLDRLEKIIEDGFAELRQEIAELKADKSERKGFITAIVTLGGAVGGVVWSVIQHIWK